MQRQVEPTRYLRRARAPAVPEKRLSLCINEQNGTADRALRPRLPGQVNCWDRGRPRPLSLNARWPELIDATASLADALLEAGEGARAPRKALVALHQ